MNSINEPPNTKNEEAYLNKSTMEEVISDEDENKLSIQYNESENDPCFGFVLGYN